MKEYAVLDEFLSKYQDSVHTSEKKLLKIIREAYPIGIPALIMKSSTDRLGTSAGYSFHLGTPDGLLRRLASWLITKNNGNHRLLLKLNKKLWKRHGREDVALSAIIIANLDHASMETNPWEIFRLSLRKKEPVDGLLLTIEELLRSGREMPSETLRMDWSKRRLVDGHLSILVTYAGMIRDIVPSFEMIACLENIKIPPNDSVISRIMDKISKIRPQE
ncbi:MAG: hypothetical protein CMB47_04420 [Euryarchaeota archaeon]|nr:hypothetical protein [Euryarchaeota archaeon]|tara:strand:+ start:114 stop:770 length:657 start_codon:yes stop_codon:yes gene_type:complete